MNVFEIVKDSVDIVDVAKHYGISVNRYKKVLCPFHNDTNPSMSFKRQGFRCFACGVHGDVIDFVGQMENLSPFETVKHLNHVYKLNIDIEKPLPSIEIQLRIQRREQKKAFEHWENAAWQILSAYFRLLCEWRTKYAPGSYTEVLHPLFIESLTKLEYIEYILYAIFINGSESDKKAFHKKYRRMVKKIEKQLKTVEVLYAGEAEHSDNPSGIVFPFEFITAPHIKEAA